MTKHTPDNVEEFYQHMLKSTPVLDKFERASLKLKHQELVTKARADGYTQGRVDEAKTCEGCSKERAEAIRMVERERVYEMFDYSDDPDYQKELTDKQEAREKAIENKETVYLSEHGNIITEDEYLEFMEYCDCVIPADVGSQREKFVQINLSALTPKHD